MQPINLIASCTDRKKATAPQELQARTLTERSASSRLIQWAQRLTASSEPSRPATDLYAGDHWHVTLSISQMAYASGRRVKLYACSAGYGLLDATAEIKPYSATFATAQPDSVVPQDTEVTTDGFATQWWSGLCHYDLPSVGPLSIRELAAERPSVPVIVIASPPYLSAMERDLKAAAQALNSPALLSIMSVGANTRRWPTLGPHLLPADARLEAVVGGTRAALNARAMRRVLELLPSDQSASTHTLSAVLNELARDLPPLLRHDRRTLTDAQVLEFIGDARRRDPSIPKTRLLRDLRASGAACEQKRFSALFRQALGAPTNAE